LQRRFLCAVIEFGVEGFGDAPVAVWHGWVDRRQGSVVALGSGHRRIERKCDARRCACLDGLAGKRAHWQDIDSSMHGRGWCRIVFHEAVGRGKQAVAGAGEGRYRGIAEADDDQGGRYLGRDARSAGLLTFFLPKMIFHKSSRSILAG
jgi:hypothetical protein